jgi:hypothetical protein
MTNAAQTKTTPQGSKFLSARFSEIKTAQEWVNAFPERYQGLSQKIKLAFAASDMRSAK